MPFLGVIPQPAREILVKYIPQLNNAHCLCSGNFSVETALSMNGFTGVITSNDVSLYSSALGWFFTNQDFRLELKPDAPEEFSFLEPFLVSPESKAATVAIMLDLLVFYHRDNLYSQKSWQAGKAHFAEILKKTIEKLNEKKKKIRITQYFAQDARDRLAEIPKDETVLTFVPTYRGGYERLYRYLEKIFSWDSPSFRLFAGELDFYHILKERGGPFIACAEIRRDDIEEIVGAPRAQTTRGNQVNVYFYSNLDLEAFYVRRRVNAKECLIPRFTDHDEITAQSVLSIHEISGPEAMYLRQVYLSNSVNPSDAPWNYVVLLDNKVLGVTSFSAGGGSVQANWKLPGDPDAYQIYLLCDLPVSCSRYSRLAKLVLAAVQSQEMKALLDKIIIEDVNWICTTAFSKNPVSMKYRGVFKLHSRKENPNGTFTLNYYSQAGQFTLEEALKLWMRKHSQH